MMTNSKMLLLIPFCFILFSSFFYVDLDECSLTVTNDVNYKRVELRLNTLDELRTIGALGIDVKCGVTSELVHGETIVTLEISEDEYSTLLVKGLDVKVLVRDLSAFYGKRAKDELPQAIAALNEKKAGQSSRNHSQDMSCTEDVYPVPTNFNLGSMGGFLTYTELLADLDLMATLYPNLITVKASASSTGQTTHEGRTIYYVKVSDNPNVDESEAQVLYTGLHHAREPGSMMNINYYLWYLLENYDSDPTIKNLVDNTELYFVPVLNPDGYVYNEQTNPNGGGLWRKNRRNNGNGSFGVDLNRNYSYQWGLDNFGSSPNPSSNTYRGPAPFSEPETQIIKSFAESHDFANVFNNHAYSNLLLYPWSYANIPTPDEELFGEMSEHMCWHNRYRYGRPSETLFYEANGDSDSWYYGEQTTKDKVMAFTPEVGSIEEGGFYPSPAFIADQCERHLHMSLVLAESASNHGILTDLTPYGISSTTSSLTFNIQHLSLPSGSFTVNISSSDPNVNSITNPNITTSVLSGTDNEEISTGFSLVSTIKTGTSVSFDITLNNGVYDIYTTTITKKYTPNVLFTDDCNSLTNWSTTSWGVDNSTGNNANGSITDSPVGISTVGTKTITLASPLDLSSVQSPVLEYYTKWDITRLFSYAQIEISTDGLSWSPLCGENTKVGVSNINNGNPDQPADEAIYDGFQEVFVREQVDLSAYQGFSTVYFRFIFDGDAEVVQNDGFWFDDFTVYAVNFIILPVELISFKGRKNGKGVILEWLTASEENSDYFEVKRSSDGVNFESIRQVEALGTSHTEAEYTVVDNNPNRGINYYRLDQFDINGTRSEAGETIAIEFQDDVVVSIRPNPVSDDFVSLYYNTLQAGQVQLEIIDVQGRVVKSQMIDVDNEKTKINIDLPGLATGLYVVRTLQAGNSNIIRFVKK